MCVHSPQSTRDGNKQGICQYLHALERCQKAYRCLEHFSRGIGKILLLVYVSVILEVIVSNWGRKVCLID